MSRVKKVISDLSELYRNLFRDESIEQSNSVDFLLDTLEEQAEANRKRMQELGQLTGGANV